MIIIPLLLGIKDLNIHIILNIHLKRYLNQKIDKMERIYLIKNHKWCYWFNFEVKFNITCNFNIYTSTDYFHIKYSCIHLFNLFDDNYKFDIRIYFIDNFILLLFINHLISILNSLSLELWVYLKKNKLSSYSNHFHSINQTFKIYLIYIIQFFK